MPLTELQIKQAKPQPKPYRMTDGHGLYLLVNEKGKYWRYDYAYFGTRKTLAIGIYPVITLAMAREKHLEARRLLAQEPPIDPSAHKKQQRTAKNSTKINCAKRL
ncbi:Arm DNA-binding domain-containing protein [Methylovorus menthalis]|uniref:Arm DNA-binding domain-containing protein n=1 Tax=Methylovorus menthalis TaxID=1002227 RepID=UPI001E616038|nr:Arm DNA-binding domain-containing protein [Methylovorus menthalis]MCB4812434.1 Arm DNA-binding domain-containing protein [Methylovorus menthalis]